MLNNKLFVIILFLCFWGCVSHKNFSSTNTRLNKQEVINYLNEHSLDYNTFYTKCNVKYIDDVQNLSFKTTFKIKKDSLIWVSVNAIFGIEVAKAIIFPDSIVFINNLSKQSFIGDFSVINKLLNSSFDFYSLQNCITNNPLLKVDKKYTFKRNENDSTLVLNKEIGDSLNYNLTTSINDPLLKTQIISSDKKTFSIAHSDYNLSNGIMFPFTLNFIMRENETVLKTLELSYLKIKINENLLFPFIIPEDYEVIY